MSATNHSVIKLTPFTVEFTNNNSKVNVEFEVPLTRQEIIDQYDYIVFPQPKVESTGLYVGKKPSEEEQFEVTLQVYKSDEASFRVKSFSEALNIQRGASQMAKLMGWTRHDNCLDEVSHLDSVFDLYNEGSIILKRVL